jgi:hypothetical protein
MPSPPWSPAWPARSVRPVRVTGVVLAALALGACASGAPLACRPGERPAVIEALYFGAARPGGLVTREEWREFVNRVVTPRFPQGLTSWEASGQWRGASGEIEREPSHVLQLVHADTGEAERAVNEIMAAYKGQFEQEAVLRIRSGACTSL